MSTQPFSGGLRTYAFDSVTELVVERTRIPAPPSYFSRVVDSQGDGVPEVIGACRHHSAMLVVVNPDLTVEPTYWGLESRPLIAPLLIDLDSDGIRDLGVATSWGSSIRWGRCGQ